MDTEYASIGVILVYKSDLLINELKSKELNSEAAKAKPPSSLDDSITFQQYGWLKLNASSISYIIIRPYSLTRLAMIAMILGGVIVVTSMD